LTAGDQRLLEKAADGFATVKAKVAWTSGKAEELLGKRRSKPLKIDRELRGVEVVTLRGG
jgi:hypothetical protein